MVFRCSGERERIAECVSEGDDYGGTKGFARKPSEAVEWGRVGRGDSGRIQCGGRAHRCHRAYRALAGDRFGAGDCVFAEIRSHAPTTASRITAHDRRTTRGRSCKVGPVRSIEFAPDAFEDLAWWAEQDRAQAIRIIRLVRDTQRDPFTGIGKPEALKHELAGCWPRLIDQEDRLMYQVLPDRVRNLAFRYHD